MGGNFTGPPINLTYYNINITKGVYILWIKCDQIHNIFNLDQNLYKTICFCLIIVQNRSKCLII